MRSRGGAHKVETAFGGSAVTRNPVG